MVAIIRSLFISIMALITFAPIGADIQWASTNWECKCSNAECGWCVAVPAPANEMTWGEWYIEEYIQAEREFDAMFNSIEYKVAKNGRSMVKGNYAKGYKFI